MESTHENYMVNHTDVVSQFIWHQNKKKKSKQAKKLKEIC